MGGAVHCKCFIHASSYEYSSFVFSVFDYIYILFWNSLWTLLPVLGIGIFDRILGQCPLLFVTHSWLTHDPLKMTKS